MNRQLLLLAGLPGSGKTAYTSVLEQQGWRRFDDFKSDAHNESSALRDSRHFHELLAALAAGCRCVVADVDFCRPEARREAEAALRAAAPEATLSWTFFENDADHCERNIKQRGRASIEQDLAASHAYAKDYAIPEGASVIPVYARDNASRSRSEGLEGVGVPAASGADPASS